MVAPHLEQQLVGVARLPDHLDLGLAEQPREAFAQQRRVVGDHRPRHAGVPAHTAERRERVRKPVGTKLEDPLGLGQASELVDADLGRRGTQAARCVLGDEHLAAVSGLADARGAMNLDPDVSVADGLRVAAVQADPHAHPLAPGQARAANACWISSAATRPAPARSKTQKSSSPRESTSRPPARRTAFRCSPRASSSIARVGLAEARGQTARVLEVAEEEGERHLSPPARRRPGHRREAPRARACRDRARSRSTRLPSSVSTRSRRPKRPEPLRVGAAGSVVLDLDHRASVQTPARTRAESAPACLTTLASASEAT